MKGEVVPVLLNEGKAHVIVGGGEGVMPAAARVMSSLPRERTCMNVMLGVNV